MKQIFTWPVCILLIFLLLLIYMAIYHCGDSLLWYDESGQFFIAKGLNHYSEPYATPGNIMDVIENNRHYNMDPGGFGIILHFWSMISEKLWFLRMLPFIFFVFFLYFTYRIAWIQTKNISVSIAIAGLLLFLPFAGFMAEIRAYSMEFMGLSLTTLCILHIDSIMSYKRLILFSIMMCVFCTSRYAFILDAFSAVLFFTGYWIFKKDSRIIQHVLTISIPLLIMVIAIYLISVRYQNQGLTKMSYLCYLSDAPLNYVNRLSILYYITISLLFYTYRKGGKLFILNAFAVCLSTVHFFASVFGFHPWDYVYFRSCSAIYLMFLTVLFTIYSVLHSNNWIIKTGLTLFCLLSVMTIAMSKKQRQSAGHEITLEAIRVSQDTTQKSIFFDAWLSPTMRYLFEYGKLKGEKQSLGYPKRFIFETGKRHSSSESNTEVYPNADQFACDAYVFHGGTKELLKVGIKDTTRYSLCDGYKYVYKHR